MAGTILAAALAMLCHGSEPIAAAPPPPAPPPPSVTCVFTNPAFSGKCVESPETAGGASAGDTCAAILACLNDVSCTKTYCQATTIRSGWRLESAK